jgi:hypothetical protein
MRPLAIILELILVVHSTARPTIQPRQEESSSTTSQDNFGTPFPTIGPDIPTPTSTTLPIITPAYCKVTNFILWDMFDIVIGVPWIGPSDCDATYHALEDATWGITLWTCERTPEGYIDVLFNCSDLEGEDIDVALQSRYPKAGGFSCPSD